MGSENCDGCAQNAENGFGFDLFRAKPQKMAMNFFSHIVTGDETWVSFVNVKTKKQSKQCMHTHSANMPKNLNTRLPES
jgi:hypothetical protein